MTYCSTLFIYRSWRPTEMVLDQNGLTAILVEAGATLMRTDYQVSEKECEGCLLLIID